MNDLKLFAKSNDQIDSLVNAVYTLSEYIGNWIWVKRRNVDKAKSRDFNLLYGKLMKTIDEKGYKYLEILEYDKLKEKEMKP